MECSCNISPTWGVGPSFSDQRIQIANEEHFCGECKRKILPKEKYEYVSGIWDDYFEEYITCIDCLSVADVFFKKGRIYSGIWEIFTDQFGYPDSDIPESCISKLTPVARAKVCRFIEKKWRKSR